MLRFGLQLRPVALLVGLLVFLQQVFLAAADPALDHWPWPVQKCKHPIVRKEWRKLCDEDKQDYLKAVQCFLKKDAITPKSAAAGVVSRYDDLVATHINQTFSIHYVGHFLPWHRWFTAYYESALRKECGYKGAQPYWDWTLDVTPSSKFTSAPVFDPVNGFGGNGPYITGNTSASLSVPGRTGGGCIKDGPFKDMVVRLGPQGSLTGTPRCLARDFSPYFAGRYLGRNQTYLTISQLDYGHFSRVVEGGPSFEASGIHGGGHYGIGGTYGQMGDLYASPTDPIFFLHHANLDRVWWSWQLRNPWSRLTDISGPMNLMDYNNTKGGNVTLDSPMSLGFNAENTTIGETMNIKGGLLCYDYDQLY